jgi:hypothetical protein
VIGDRHVQHVVRLRTPHMTGNTALSRTRPHMGETAIPDLVTLGASGIPLRGCDSHR